MAVRSHLIAVLLLIGFVFSVVGSELPVFSVIADQGSLQVETSMWRRCVKSLVQGVKSENCTALELGDMRCSSVATRVRAARAFVVMTNIAAFVAMVAASGRVVVAAQRRVAVTNMIVLVAAAVAVFCSLVALPVVVSLYTEEFCNEVSVKASKHTGVGPSPTFIGLDFGVLLTALAFEKVGRLGTQSTEAVSDEYAAVR